VAHASSQGTVVLPARLRFSICRRYAAARNLGNMRVLVVEDEPYMAEAIRDGLRLEAMIVRATRPGIGGALLPGRSPDQQAFGEAAAIALAFLLVFGLAGGWILAGRMLAPLARITDATRTAANGSLAHRIRLPGRSDEFREVADAFDTMLEQLESRRPFSISPATTRAATAASSTSASAPSTPGRSTSPRHCCCSAGPASGPSPGNTSTCPSSRKKPPRRSPRIRHRAAQHSHPPRVRRACRREHRREAHLAAGLDTRDAGCARRWGDRTRAAVVLMRRACVARRLR
jgi:HAMP domain-containing protein